MPYSNFPQGFAYGFSNLGLPLTTTNTGAVFWLNNSPILRGNQKAGSDGNRGTFLDPLGSLSFALSRCTPGRGDIIMVASGHYETISTATALAFSTAGVIICGIVEGGIRPTFVFSAAAATIAVTAANVQIHNCLFVANFAAVTSLFTMTGASVTASIAAGPGTYGTMTVTVVGSGTIVIGNDVSGTGVTPDTEILSQISGTTGGVGTYLVSNSQTFASGTLTSGPKDFWVDNCEFRDQTSALNFVAIVTTPTVANTADGLVLSNNKVFGLGTTAATTPFKVSASLARLQVVSNYVVLAILNDTSALLALGASVLTQAMISSNTVFRPNTTTANGFLISGSATTCTGVVRDNYAAHVTTAGALLFVTGLKLMYFNNLNIGDADASGFVLPAIGAN